MKNLQKAGAGQTGSIRTTRISEDWTITEHAGGQVVEVDPGGGTVTVTLPSSGPGCGRGYFAEILQVSAGTVQIRGDGGPDGTIVSTAGATPDITEPWTSARVRRRDFGGGWVVEGAV
jgi:hypothetical protein